MSFSGPATTSNADTAGTTDPGNTVAPSLSNVCDPLGNGSTTVKSNNGLVGSLRYLTPAQLTDPKLGSDYANFSEVYNGGLGYYNGNVFLSSVNVPTRDFTEGFSDNSGGVLLQTDGTTLIQYFALQLQSVLVLGHLNPGKYQLAVLSDDGSILTVKGGVAGANGSSSDLVINNDGAHSNLLGCNALPVTLSANSAFPLTLQYYQGPPVSIAAMVLYRQAPSDNSLDPDCGIGKGDDYYFSRATNPSTPLAPYQALQARGWSPLPAANYELPGATVNPCAN
jgi:hypothetical protein